MKGLAITVIAMLGALNVHAQSTPEDARAKLEEAKAKLAEKDQQRQAEREKMVSITAGELSDLRVRIAQLESENKALKGQSAGGKNQPRKVYSMIEIGMTKDEVMTFVRNRSGMRIVAIRADAGVSKSTETVVVRKTGTVNRDVSVTNGEGQSESDTSRRRTKASEDGTTNTEVDRIRSTGRRETIEIAQFGTYREQAGTKRNSLGGHSAVYENVERETGRLSVTLVDGVVAAVEAR
jgi:hypothetical protein